MFALSNDRNGTSVFAQRTIRNLDSILKLAERGEDAHPVTQAISALLGIVVFPWEKNALHEVKRMKLQLIECDGWPKWTMSGPRRVRTLGDLLQSIRNATSHGNIEFDSNAKEPSKVGLTLTNRPGRDRPSDWVGKIRCDQLIDFCRHLCSALEKEVG